METILHTAPNGGNQCSFVPGPIRQSAPELRQKSRQSIAFSRPPYIIGRSSVVGEREGAGPVGKHFHQVVKDEKFGEKTFEKAELKMLSSAVRGAVFNAGIGVNDVDLLLAGDLLNQITSSSYVARELRIPYLGLYSACATMAECLAIGASLLDAGLFSTVACATASHFATAERQYRYPLEYGCQRPPYAQWTVTGAACSVLSNELSEFSGMAPNAKSEMPPPRITMAAIGKVVDFGISDLNNMGAAMAPAALDTLIALFKENNLSEKDFDLIVTGDLGKLGSDILRDLMREQGYELGKNYTDCGTLIYDWSQKCYQGGSGAACSATVVNSFVLDKMAAGEYRKIAYVATGALMNPLMCYQGETIPCISHAVVIES